MSVPNGTLIPNGTVTQPESARLLSFDHMTNSCAAWVSENVTRELGQRDRDNISLNTEPNKQQNKYKRSIIH